MNIPIIFLIFGIIWLISLLVVPIIQKYKPKLFDLSFLLGVIAQLILVMVIFFYYEGLEYHSLLFIAIPLFGWLAEFIGSRTGFPFGKYSYTDKLKPHIFKVPLAVPLAWVMMALPSMAIGQLLAGMIVPNPDRFLVSIISAFVMTAWDLFLDPQMVGFGFWKWQKAKGFFGIPWSNFIGWFVVSFCMSFLFYTPLHNETRIYLMYVYVLSGILETIALFFFWKHKGPALIGFAVLALSIILPISIYFASQN